MSDHVVGLIPARYHASRFPGKLLADLGGAPVIRHVIDHAASVSRFDALVVATDDERIAAAARAAGADVHETRSDHPSGTDRIGEVVRARGWDSSTVVNIQADEPFLGAGVITDTLDALAADPEAEIGTAATVADPAEWSDPSTVKVARSASGRALYFSRAAVPWSATPDADAPLAHVGIYAFRPGVLLRFVRLGPSDLERRERLEQLRALEAGMRITVALGHYDTIGIDTPSDLERARRRLSRSSA